ncbi:MAG: MBL fold metallo-hydrolase, partial [Myxococcales bacterium]|nr:MBL fold metallo-hydrolase [Myxococcales bacterium]
MALADRPSADELEISLFGPGVGECVAVHLGCGEWMIVDSCVDPATRNPAALDYLGALGVDVSTAVKHVVVTHWHDDHIRGAARILDAARCARFICSASLRRDEFKRFIASRDTLNVQAGASSGIEEFSAVLEILAKRHGSGARRDTVGPEWACADRLLYRRAAGVVRDCDVSALSPSAATLTRGLHEIAALLPAPGAPKRVAVGIEPNDTCLVLSVRFGDAVAILGSDLETGAAPTIGWAAVLTTQARPASPAHVFKVPHHGSSNAYHAEVWTSMLRPADPVAVLTPFSRGRKYLPSEGDIARMKSHTTKLFVTARRPPKGAVTDSVVERTVKEVAREFRMRESRMGHVRIRGSS